jgi:hypothetical protein
VGGCRNVGFPVELHADVGQDDARLVEDLLSVRWRIVIKSHSKSAFGRILSCVQNGSAMKEYVAMIGGVERQRADPTAS